MTVSEWPFKLFYLPLRASQIDIVENFVATDNQVAVSVTGDGTGGRRVLGIDVGTVRVGLAVSDETCTLATPLATIPNKSRTMWARIAREMEDRDVDRVVIGLPRRLDGNEGDASQHAERSPPRLRSGPPRRSSCGMNVSRRPSPSVR